MAQVEATLLAVPGDANGAPPIAGLIHRAARDDKPRRSISYLHTEPFELVVDRATGVEYEVRACKYCDTAFSFKGGTTSAAMRHLRLAHSQEVFGVPAAPKPTPQYRRAVPALLQILREEPPEAHDNDTADELEHDHEADVELPAQEHDDTGHEPEEGVAEGGVAAEGAAAQDADTSPAVPTSHEALDDEPDDRSPRAPARVHYYKRRRYDDDSHSNGHLPLSVNQVAVAHFIAHYKHALPPSKRFAFIKHLTYNDREAAMYNVLDDEMRLEFLAQFNAAPSAAPSAAATAREL